MLENRFGAFARISTLFAARGFSIDLLSVDETEDPAILMMRIVAKGDDFIFDHVTKQLNKLNLCHNN